MKQQFQNCFRTVFVSVSFRRADSLRRLVDRWGWFKLRRRAPHGAGDSSRRTSRLARPCNVIQYAKVRRWFNTSSECPRANYRTRLHVVAVRSKVVAPVRPQISDRREGKKQPGWADATHTPSTICNFPSASNRTGACRVNAGIPALVARTGGPLHA